MNDTKDRDQGEVRRDAYLVLLRNNISKGITNNTYLSGVTGLESCILELHHEFAASRTCPGARRWRTREISSPPEPF